MKTAVEWLEERLNISIGDELKPLRGFFVIAKEMEQKQIEDAVKKATLLKKDYTDELFSNGVVNSKNKSFYCASKLLGEQKCKYQCFDCVGYKA